MSHSVRFGQNFSHPRLEGHFGLVYALKLSNDSSRALLDLKKSSSC